MAHPNEELMRRGYEAFMTGDLETVMGIFDENIEWHVPGGQSPLAGEYKGREQVRGFLLRIFELSEGTFSVEVHDVLANDDHAVVMLRATARRAGKSLDSNQCHVWHIKGSQATEFWGLDTNPFGTDEFWS
ncbi:MAG TPA: nuclear transport factor 2 family protein [Acidimicrobiales bacterium]|nr:nuclear transport factor 2 family protein [Acidimicrobiales bacterium]